MLFSIPTVKDWSLITRMGGGGGGGRGSKPEGGHVKVCPYNKKKKKGGGVVSRTEGGKGAFYSVLRVPQKGFDL